MNLFKLHKDFAFRSLDIDVPLCTDVGEESKSSFSTALAKDLLSEVAIRSELLSEYSPGRRGAS